MSHRDSWSLCDISLMRKELAMNVNPEIARREDVWSAAIVQYGIALSSIVGIAGAQRYLLSRCIPLHIIERVLCAPIDARRMPARAMVHTE
jgi:hypothetical protein